MRKVLTSAPPPQAPIEIWRKHEFNKKIIHQEEFLFGSRSDSFGGGDWARAGNIVITL